MSAIEGFSSREALADAATDILAGALGAADARAFAAAGGSTPGPVYDRLARRDLEWGRLSVTLTDERVVDAASDESNERLIRERLLVNEAAGAAFVALNGGHGPPKAEAAAAETRIRAILPFAAVLLGMGADGHVASLFPGAPELEVALDLDASRLCVAVDKAGLPPFVPRISLTARALIQTGLLLVLITGEDKRAVMERIGADPEYAPPVATLLRQDRCPVRVLWAP